MTQSAKNELEAIKRTLNTQVTELENIQNGIRKDFTGIGNDVCAKKLDPVITRLKKAQRLLNNLDTTTIDPDFVPSP